MGFGQSGGGGATLDDLPYRSGWLGIDAPLIGNLPSELNTASGASPSTTSTDQTGTLLTSGDAAGEQSTVTFLDDVNLNNATKMILGVLLYHDSDFGASSTDFPLIGLFDESNPDNGDNDIAIIDTGQGDNSSGNVRVDNNGTDTDGTFDFSDQLNDISYYEILIDIANTVTEVRENASAFDGSQPGVSVSAVPRIGQGRSLGVGIMGSNQSTVRVAHLRSAVHVLP